MGIEHLKIWHWCIIGVLAGAAVAFIKMESGVSEPPGNEPVSIQVFEDHLIRKIDPSKRRLVEVRNIRVHPVGLGDFNVPGSDKAVKLPFISYEIVLARRNNPKLGDVFQRETFPEFPHAAKHDQRYMNRQTREVYEQLDKLNDSVATDKLSLTTFLDRLNEIIGKLDKGNKQVANAMPAVYKKNWWETPRAMYSIYMTGGFVAIGLIFPTLIQLLTVAGYGRQPREKDDYDLNRFASGEEPKPARKVVLDEKEQLAALEAELEAKLKSGASSGDSAPSPAPAPAKPVIAKLTAGKLEAPKEVEEAKPVRKGYGADHGDYYPTEVHGKKNS
jgi:hypothetical protein